MRPDDLTEYRALRIRENREEALRKTAVAVRFVDGITRCIQLDVSTRGKKWVMGRGSGVHRRSAQEVDTCAQAGDSGCRQDYTLIESMARAGGASSYSAQSTIENGSISTRRG